MKSPPRIEDEDYKALPDELGDLLFQVVFHARMAEEAGPFDFGDVVEAVTDKMIARHPHVFGGGEAAATPRPESWPGRRSRPANARPRPRQHPGRCAPGPARAAACGKASDAAPQASDFDWDDAGKVVEKIAEEAGEIVEARHGASRTSARKKSATCCSWSPTSPAT